MNYEVKMSNLTCLLPETYLQTNISYGEIWLIYVRMYVRRWYHLLIQKPLWIKGNKRHYIHTKFTELFNGILILLLISSITIFFSLFICVSWLESLSNLPLIKASTIFHSKYPSSLIFFLLHGSWLYLKNFWSLDPNSWKLRILYIPQQLTCWRLCFTDQQPYLSSQDPSGDQTLAQSYVISAGRQLIV